MFKRAGILFISKSPLLTPSQYKFWSQWFSGVSQAITIGVLAAKFIPQVMGLPKAIEDFEFVMFLSFGLTIAFLGSMLSWKGDEE